MSELLIIEKPSQVEELIHYCQTTKMASIDYETSDRRFETPEEYPLILGVSFQPGSSWILPLEHKDSPFKKTWKKHFKVFSKEVLENYGITKIAWNLKFEYKWGLRYGSFMKGRLFDGMLAKYCLDEERPHDLKDFVATFFPKYANYEDDIDPKVPWPQKDFLKLSKYCGIDADLTHRGMIYLENRLMEHGFYNLFRNLLMMMSRVLAESEYRGMFVDREYLEQLIIKYKALIAESEQKMMTNKAVVKYQKKAAQAFRNKMISQIQQEIEELEEEEGSERKIAFREAKIKKIAEGQPVGKKETYQGFNPGSPPQMGEFLYSKIGLGFKCKDFTETGKPSTAEETLLKFEKKDKSGFITQLLEYRGLEKIDGTYVRGMLPHLDFVDRAHATFHIHGCVTPDTPLMTNRGKIYIGDIIPNGIGVINIEDMGLEILTHKKRFRRITHSVNKGWGEMVSITIEDGRTIKCTPAHKFKTDSGWKPALECWENKIPIYTFDIPELEELPRTIKPPTEEIISIRDWDGYYISNWGKVYSSKKLGGRGSIGKLRELKPRIVKNYRRVGFRKNDGKKYNFKVSTLVFEAFIGNIPIGYEVDHINCYKLDDYSTNLQLLKREENFNRAFKYNIKAHHRNLTHNQGFRKKLITEYVSIGQHLICDLTVEQDRSYIANGIVNHNTVTGRLSCVKPNLQNIPRGSTAADIKKMFIPPKGYLLVEVDYSQAELRVIAEVSNDKAMIDIFNRGYNIHVATGCKMVGKIDEYDRIKALLKIAEALPAADLQKPENKEYLYWVKQKKKGKSLNFSIVYQQGDDATAETLGCTVEEAAQFKKTYFAEFPGVKKWIDSQKKFAKKHGYVLSMFGRKRRLHDIHSEKGYLKAEAERQAVNAPIQGASGDFTLFSQVVIRDKILKGELPREVLQAYTVHDSIGFYMPPKIIHSVVPEIIRICDNPDTKKFFGFELKKVKMKVSPEVGKNWADLVEYDEKEDYSKWL